MTMFAVALLNRGIHQKFNFHTKTVARAGFLTVLRRRLICLLGERLFGRWVCSCGELRTYLLEFRWRFGGNVCTVQRDGGRG